jgi:hypothetical protein
MGDRTDWLGAAKHHSRADFESAMSKLSVADLIRLKRVSLKYSGGSGMSPDELLSEAYVRTAANSRNWPVGVGVVRFMAEAMRSIASGARDTVKAEARSVPVAIRSAEMVDADAEAVTDQRGVIIDFIRPSPSPEQQLVDREEAAADASRL